MAEEIVAAEIEMEERNRGEAAIRIDKDLPKEGKIEEKEKDVEQLEDAVVDVKQAEDAVVDVEQPEDAVMDVDQMAEIGTEEREGVEAAIRIDRDLLYVLLKECTAKSNPLHLGAQHGQVRLVGDILSEKPESAYELNSQGQSPLHLASARGHVEVVREILNADPGARFVRNRDGMIPLHLAAIKGRLDVLAELVGKNSKNAYILTDGGQPILHLCVKNNQFEALKTLVELVQDDDFVNLKDDDDNTILHALSEDGDLKAIKYLVEKTKVEVNAVNKNGLKPLDVVLETASKIHGWKIHRLLVSNGAKSSNERMDNLLVDYMGPLIMSLDSNDGSWFIEALMVVAVLMVSVAFQARLSPPGGVWQDTGFHNATFSSNATSLSFKPPGGVGPLSYSPILVPHLAGQSIMSYVDSGRYNLFALFNDFTLSSSMLVIQVLLIRRFFNLWILKIVAVFLTSVSVVALSVTYVVSMAFISSDEKSTRTYFFVYSLSTILYFTFGVWLFLRLLSCMLGPTTAGRSKASVGFRKCINCTCAHAVRGS